jgi:hypothetical protein
VQDRLIDPPAGCPSIDAEALIPSGQAPSMFWRSADVSARFTVLVDERTAASCPTLRRGATDTCEFTLTPSP